MEIMVIIWKKEKIKMEVKMEIEKGRLIGKITQEAKMKTDKITCEQMKNPNALSAREVGKLIAKYEYAQTPEMVKYYKSLNPSARDVAELSANCKYTQTPQMVEYFKSLNPSVRDVINFITECKYAQTTEMTDYYKSLLQIRANPGNGEAL